MSNFDAICKAVNNTPLLQSLLYDLNLLPEQTHQCELRWGYTVAVVNHFGFAILAERYLWLRNELSGDNWEPVFDETGTHLLSGDQLDKAIDAAIAANTRTT